MRYSTRRIKGLIQHNVHRCLQRHCIDPSHFDNQEIDDTLTHHENLTNILDQRGLRTRAEERALLAYYRELEEDYCGRDT